jgi:hypothetical protein
LKRLSVFLTVVFLAVGPGLAEAGPESDSYVIGRITGTHQELPGYFRNNEHLAARGIDEVEFTGFRLVREEDGKSFIIVPNLHGYFYQALPAGMYTLIRKRYDRPGYREPKTIAIMKFEVESGTLVNLGTVHLILDGPPRESLRLMGDNAKGTYTYRYRYERETGDSAYEMPLSWFTDKKPAVKAGFGDKIVQEETQPTREMDGSKVTLREVIPWTKK